MGRYSQVLFSLAALLLLAIGCRSNKDRARELAAKVSQEQPEFVMRPFRIQAYGRPGIEWEVRAPEARAYTSMNVMRAEQIEMALFEQGALSTTIRSDRGVFCIQDEFSSPNPRVRASTSTVQEQGYSLNAGDMFLSGNVVVISTDGSKLTTDWVHYQKSADIINSTAPVKIVRNDSITNGVGLQATPDLKRVKIFNQTLVIKGDEEKK